MANEMRVTCYFGQAQTGWSETWWYPGGRNTLFYSRLSALATRRVNLLTTNHQLLAIRITEEGANRFTRLILGGGPTQLDSDGTTIILPGRGIEDGGGSLVEGPPDQVRAAMHIEVVKDGQRLGLRYLAGFPDNISLTENPTLGKNVSSKWWDLFNPWRVGLLADGWAIKTIDKSASFPLMPVLAVRMRSAAPSVLGLVVSTTFPFGNTIGMKVALQGVRMTRRGLASPNGTWIIDGVETDTPLAQRTIWLRATAGFDPTTFISLGKVRALNYTYTVPTWLEPIRVGIHKRGKPFGSPVGRRLTRA